MSNTVHVELIRGRRVRDMNGEVVGRIASIHVEVVGNRCFVREYCLGPAALLEVLGISAAGLVGWPLSREPLCVPWDQLDLSDPDQLRLRCTLEDLEKMTRRSSF